MKVVTITRDPSGPDGTFGVFNAVMLSGYSAEPNDHANRPSVSCIPVGSYPCKRIKSPKYGDIFEVTGVTGREHILIHWGNFAADPPRKSDTEGCILIGGAIGEIAGQPALLGSKEFFNRFMASMEGENEFTLRVEWRA